MAKSKRQAQATRTPKQLSEKERAWMSFQEGYWRVMHHEIFAPLYPYIHVVDERRFPRDGWAVISDQGTLYVSTMPVMGSGDWSYIVAHSVLHLAMGHFVEKEHPKLWNAACDLVVTRFLAELKIFGTSPGSVNVAPIGAGQNEEMLYERFCVEGVPEHQRSFGMGGANHPDMIREETRRRWYLDKEPDWQHLFGVGLRMALVDAVDTVGMARGQSPRNRGPAAQAKAWFINQFPLLGALATSFKIIEDQLLCQRMDISVAAVDAEAQAIYFNPAAALNEDEYLFVMAHELLHVGLRHHARREGRDAYLWNIACDYVINGWLIEMGIGSMPPLGAMYDPQFKNESAESIYDRIVDDLRKYQREWTLRGKGLGDMLEPRKPGWWGHGEGLALDEFYRRCLGQGLVYHNQYGRGFMPAGLMEEILAQSQPPVPWDVELAQWFDHYFPAVEKVRSYARASRRQASTPDIPRPRWVIRPDSEDGRTFGVVLDTSGSMESTLLAKALGAIASYSMARDVPAARVVFCDAAAYDAGYMPPEAIADRVRVKGRGGTVLQPGINLLENAEDFPKDGPILIITDGECDVLRIRRDHAFLMPDGHTLPFHARGPIFKVS
jgi:predicted metal-dependent peptidase